ncbi:MAG: hypothetical protein LBE03_01520 [Candidatus Nomurabacteria bacterium]|jgi:hypothetical protein|nr:hypothetical protein [Candidatus Nomurabacteria bacterium]
MDEILKENLGGGDKPEKPRINYNGITLFFIVVFLLIFLLGVFFGITFMTENSSSFSIAYGAYYLIFSISLGIAILSGSASLLLAIKHPVARIMSNITFGVISVDVLIFVIVSLGSFSGIDNQLAAGSFLVGCAVPIICLWLIFNRADGLPRGSRRETPRLSWFLGLLVPIFLAVIVVVLGLLSVAGVFEEGHKSSSPGGYCYDNPLDCAGVAKPVIYLYPERTTDVKVNLSYDGEITSYPELGEGWWVTAQPDSTLTNKADGREYSYLFWEGELSHVPEYDMTKGFVVAGEETREFLQEKLAEIGLTPKEYNEFIVYWYPKMKNNPYNLIHFATYEEYDVHAKLDISPAPDKMLRVFMVFEPLSQPIEVTPQKFDQFVRSGFTVVEWGGSELWSK